MNLNENMGFVLVFKIVYVWGVIFIYKGWLSVIYSFFLLIYRG